MKNIVLSMMLLAMTFAHGQSPSVSSKKGTTIKLVFRPVVGTSALVFGSNYTTAKNDTFSINKFKYYIGHLSFLNADGKKEVGFDDYFLLDESDSSSASIILPMQFQQSFTQLCFLLGVDSAKNTSGVQTGALDPANGMFWTWNSGYIMAKLEGRSPQSKAPFGKITYHIGGFSQQYSALRKVSLSLGEQPITEGRPNIVTININVDVAKWFDGPHPLKIADEPFYMSPGKMAAQIADNYAAMFSISNITVK